MPVSIQSSMERKKGSTPDSPSSVALSRVRHRPCTRGPCEAREVQTDGEGFRQRGLSRSGRPAYQDGQRQSIRHGGTVSEPGVACPRTPGMGAALGHKVGKPSANPLEFR